MRLLVVSPRFPWPLNKADSMTVYHFLKFFSERHTVDLLAFGERGFGHTFQSEYVSHVRPFCRRIEVVPLGWLATQVQCLRSLPSADPLQVWYYRRRRMHAALQSMLGSEQYDMIYTHLLRMAQYTKGSENQRKVLAMQISLALEYRRLAEHQEDIRNPLKRWLYRVEAKKLRSYEAALTRAYDRVLVIGEKDRDEIVANGGDASRLFLNPHGVDLLPYRTDVNRSEAGAIVFSGNMSNDPNIDAIMWFARSILPVIEREVPQVRLYVVGASPSRCVRKLAKNPRITVTGFVEDVYPWLVRCQVAVDPMRIAAGFQNKVLEAMALRLPVVATSVANEGIGAKHGTEIMIADREDQFAQHVVDLLRDQDLRTSLGDAGFRLVSEGFTWEQHYADLERELLRLVRH